MDVNATGTFLCSQAVARQMASQSPPGGSIVHISCTSTMFLRGCL
jgi:NAD(P)-dependent dehydrogenase (short-subunit alcohol dehydrogenase family)